MARFRSILVPVVDDSASLEAVSVGAAMVQEQGVLRLLHVIQVDRSLPVNADLDLEVQRGEMLLRRAQDLAERELAGEGKGRGWGKSGGKAITIESDIVNARAAGPAIVKDAEEFDCEVIMLGVGWTPLLGQFEVGPTAGYVLGHASCNVWIVRDRLERAAPAARKAEARR